MINIRVCGGRKSFLRIKFQIDIDDFNMQILGWKTSWMGFKISLSNIHLLFSQEAKYQNLRIKFKRCSTWYAGSIH
jgi:hypothetical protein